MQLTAQQKNDLRKVIKMLTEILEETPAKSIGNKFVAKNGSSSRVRRSGAELTRFRKQLKSDRKAGVPVAELAKKYGVSPSYIYQIQ